MFRKIRYRLVHNRNKQPNRRGESLVQVEIQQNGERRYFSTRIYVREDQWDGAFVVNHPLAEEYNNYLYDELTRIQKVEFDFLRRGKTPTLSMIKKAVKEDISVTARFADFVRSINRNSSTRSKQTKAGYETLIKQVHRFDGEDVTIEEIDLDWIERFVGWSKRNGLSLNTIIGRLKSLRAIINEAVRRKLIKREDDPFLSYRIPTMKARDEHLSMEEVERIRTVKVVGRRDRKIRDAFIFACYTGFRFSDLNTLTSDNLVEVNGNMWIVKKPLKTRETSAVTVKIPVYAMFGGGALRLIEQYGSIERLCHIGNNASANRSLKGILGLAGISSERKISFHVARHTCACLLLEEGVPLTTIQSILGHTKISTTQIYAKMTTSTVQHDIEKAFHEDEKK